MKKDYSNKGFTLVEMIVVIVIIGILLAILVPGMFRYIQKAKEQQAIVECRAVVTATETLSLEQYAKGIFLSEKFNQYYSHIITECDVTGEIITCTFQDSTPQLQTLNYKTTSGIIVLYDRNRSSVYTITNEITYSASADGYMSFAQNASSDKTVQESNGYNNKTKALQKLFTEKYADATLSDYEKQIFNINKNLDADSFHWIPTYTKTGEIILLCTSTTISSSKTNYSGSIIFYEGSYYYYYANKNQKIGNQYVGDQSFDINKLTTAPVSPTDDMKDTWIKYTQ